MIAGSSGLLAAESLGYSRGQVDRDVSVEGASDGTAYLGLIDHDETPSDGVETHGLLFEDDPDNDRYPPAVFDVVNQLSEAIAVTLTLTDERFRFEPVDGSDSDDERVRVETELKPGTAISTAINLHNRADWPTDGESVTTALEIEANGEETRIEAERTLTLTSDVLLVIDLCAVSDVPDALITVRKRRVDGSTPSLLVERIDCSDGTTTVVYETTTVTVPPLRLSFPDVPAAEFDPAVVAADAVSATVDRPAGRTPSDTPDSRSGRGQRRGTRDESDSGNRTDVPKRAGSPATAKPTIRLEPDPSVDESQSVHQIDVPLEE